MAVTRAVTGEYAQSLIMRTSLTGDRTGGDRGEVSKNITFNSAVTAPISTGYMVGAFTAAAGDWELAHADDPLGAMGDAAYSDGFTVAGTKIKYIRVENTDSTNSITLTRTVATGLTLFLAAADDAITIPAGGVFEFYAPAGGDALTNDTNDHLTVSVSAGAPTGKIFVVYGS